MNRTKSSAWSRLLFKPPIWKQFLFVEKSCFLWVTEILFVGRQNLSKLYRNQRNQLHIHLQPFLPGQIPVSMGSFGASEWLANALTNSSAVAASVTSRLHVVSRRGCETTPWECKRRAQNAFTLCIVGLPSPLTLEKASITRCGNSDSAPRWREAVRLASDCGDIATTISYFSRSYTLRHTLMLLLFLSTIKNSDLECFVSMVHNQCLDCDSFNRLTRCNFGLDPQKPSTTYYKAA